MNALEAKIKNQNVENRKILQLIELSMTRALTFRMIFGTEMPTIKKRSSMNNSSRTLFKYTVPAGIDISQLIDYKAHIIEHLRNHKKS